LTQVFDAKVFEEEQKLRKIEEEATKEEKQ
jgi:hypothetical protein